MKRVLILETDSRVAQLKKRFVDDIQGFETVAIAETVHEAKTSVEILEPDLVIMDVKLQQEDGIPFIHWVRAQALDIDFIVVSAAQSADCVKTLIRLGVMDFILKPMPFSRLQKSLQAYQQRDIGLQRTQLDQQEYFDLVFHSIAVCAEGNVLPLPKGIDEMTLQSVRQALTQHSDTFYNVDEFGSFTGLSRTTMRRYLDYLVELKEMDVKNIHGSIGRPERKYCFKV
ncbi:response regulator [Bowmanella sp. Y26]|uniref:response regulator n=1 Tax=Bowmanella yangjiangensis TaxID=2811230 RepID=UPI001BDC5E93|nr:response regulator [Bowmanella yangjiangensis]MBT1064386.1 response regulator [Bowmanella yangjiangensis]